ncbi:MAG: radical SAM protein [Candidatus Kuenenia sp.]|nr:radical SAM protein [Candidatus Kuenenia hertensis]
MDETVEEFYKKYRAKNLPWMVHWELTYGCNLTCVHCYTGSEKSKKELSLSQIKDIAQQLKEMGTIYVILSGGEPFARQDIMEIIEVIRKDFFVIILTNATLITSSQAKRLKELQVSSVEISLYAIDENLHDSITGVKGSYTKTIEGINRLIEEGVRIRIKSSIIKQNLMEYPKLFSFARQLGVDFSASPTIIPRLNGVSDTYNNALSEEELAVYSLQWIKHNSEIFEKDAIHTISEEREFNCNAGNTTCSITPDGSVKPCPVLPVKLGNLLEKSYKELWVDKPQKNLKDLRVAGLNEYSKCKTCSWSSSCSPCPGANWLENKNEYIAAKKYCSRVEGIGKAIIKQMKLKI